MSDLSNEFENRVATWLFRPATSVTRPTALWLALYTAVTDAEAGTGTEVTGGSYARVDVTSAFSAPANGVLSNTANITFPTPTGNWGTITHVAIRDASTGGNAVTVIKALASAVTVNNGDPPPGMYPGDLVFTVQ
jgi:hypothetical protein